MHHFLIIRLHLAVVYALEVICVNGTQTAETGCDHALRPSPAPRSVTSRGMESGLAGAFTRQPSAGAPGRGFGPERWLLSTDQHPLPTRRETLGGPEHAHL